MSDTEVQLRLLRTATHGPGGIGAVLRSPRVRVEADDVIFALEELFGRR